MSINLDISNKDFEAIKNYADTLGLTIAECLVKVARELAEDAYDLECYEKAKAEFEKDPVTYTMDEVAAKYGFK